MVTALTCVGILIGALVAVAIHLLFRRLRGQATVPTAIVGWIITSGAIIICGLVMLNSLDIGGMLAIVVFGWLGACALVGALQNGAFEMPWWKTTGTFVTELCLAILIGYLFSQFEYPISGMLLGRSGDIARILECQAEARSLLGTLGATLVGSLLLFETSASLARFHRRKRMPAPEVSA